MHDANAMKPRLLLVEDDPTSRAFLTAAAEAVPAQVDAADSMASAITLATSREYALWLFDARLPDGSGADLLARLRAQGLSTPALAHTASRDENEHVALTRAGFLATLVKPLAADELRAAIARVLGYADAHAPPPSSPGREPLLWDDAAALTAMNGNREHVDALRTLFLAELSKQRECVLAALQGGDHSAAHDLLHRLKASCGFVGAQQLRSAVDLLDAALDDPLRVAAFSDAVQRTLVPSHDDANTSQLL